MLDPISEALRKRYVKTPTVADPILTAASTVSNTRESLRSVGVEPITPEKPWFESTLEHLSRPGAAVRGAIAGQGLAKGFQDPTSVPTGQEQLKGIADSGAPLAAGIARYLGRSGLGRFAGGTALEIAQDPLTFVGATPIRKGGEVVGRSLSVAGRAVGPDLAPAGRALSGALNRIPGVQGVREQVGRTLNTSFVPFDATVGEKLRLPQAYDVIGNSARKAATTTPVAAEERIAAGVAEGIAGPAAREATDVSQLVPVAPAPPTAEGRRAAALFADSYRRDISLQEALGVKSSVLDNFTYYRYNDEPKKVREALALYRSTLPPGPGVNKALPDNETAKAFGLHPEEDGRRLMAVHRAEVVKLQAYHEMISGMQRLGPDVIDYAPKPGWIPAKTLPSIGSYKAAQDLYVHPEVARRLTNLAPLMTAAPEGAKLLRLIGNAMRLWKGITLATPSFHIRNATGNVWLNIADGVWNPKRYEQAGALLTGQIDSVELAGRMFSRDEIMTQFDNFGLRGQGIFQESASAERYKTIASEALRKAETTQGQQIKHALVPSADNKLAPLNTLLSGSRRVGEEADSFGRMTNWLHHLDQGEDFAQAARSTRKALFDYGDLTPQEQFLRQWIIPFYPWMRFNLPKQMELLLSNPKMAASTETLRRNAVEATGANEANLPKWLKEFGAIPFRTSGDEDTVNYLTLNLPLYELQVVHDPRDVQELFRDISMMVSPFLTTPFQIGGNISLFTGRPITQTPDIRDQALEDYARFLFQQIGGGAGRAFNQANAETETTQRQLLTESKGRTPPPAPPRFAGAASPFLPVSAQSLTLQSAGGVFRERDLLLQQKAGVELERGEALPNATELAAQRATSGVDPISGALAAVNAKPATSLPAAGVGGDPISAAVLANQGKVPSVETGTAPALIINAVRAAGVGRDWEPYLDLLASKTSGNNPSLPGGLFNLDPAAFRTAAAAAAARNPAAFSQGFNQQDPMQNTLAAIEFIRTTYQHPSRIPGLR